MLQVLVASRQNEAKANLQLSFSEDLGTVLGAKLMSTTMSLPVWVDLPLHNAKADSSPRAHPDSCTGSAAAVANKQATEQLGSPRELRAVAHGHLMPPADEDLQVLVELSTNQSSGDEIIAIWRGLSVSEQGCMRLHSNA